MENKMDPDTLRLAIFAEELAVLAAKAAADLRAVLHGASLRAVGDILDDADSAYRDVIAKAKAV
jgi:hypothetical protein